MNAGGLSFALYVKREGNLNGKPATSISYFHHDHLGSIAAISDEFGHVTEPAAYRPNRYGSSKSMKSCSASASSTQAFTPGSARTRAT